MNRNSSVEGWSLFQTESWKGFSISSAYFADIYIYAHFEGKLPFNYNLYITFKKETLIAESSSSHWDAAVLGTSTNQKSV